MQIAIVSDTHNNDDNAREAARLIRARGITTVLHCGDITGPETLACFEGFQLLAVFGNIDAWRSPLEATAKRLGFPPIEDVREFSINGISMGQAHGHESTQLHGLIHSGTLRYVFCGHTHRRRDERIGPTRVINPGALGGRKVETRSFALLDLSSDRLEIVELG